MTTYEWVCHDCKLVWTRQYQMGKAPKKTKCPECSKRCERNYESFNFTVKGTIHKTGKDDVMRFYNEAIQDSKDNLKDQKSPYRRMEMTVEGAEAMGGRRLTEREVAEKAQRAKQAGENFEDLAKKKK